MKKIFFALFIIVFAFSCNNKSGTELKLIPVKSENSFGYIDHNGKYIINPQFNHALPFFCGLALVETADRKFGYINEEGKYVVNPIYSYATDFVNGVALAVKENSTIEIINIKGETKVMLDGAISKATNFTERLALVGTPDGKFGYVNEEGKIVIPINYFKAKSFSEGLASVGNGASGNGDTTWVDDGTHKYDNKIEKYGFINKKGELVIDYQFTHVGDFSEGMAIASTYGISGVGFIGKDGKNIIEPQFIFATPFSGGLAAVFKDGHWGYIDKKGVIVINPQFTNADSFYENDLAAVQSTDGKYGYIDKKGNYQINPQFNEASRFYGNIAIVKIDNLYGLIDKKGTIVVNPQFKDYIDRPVEISSEVYRTTKN